MRYFNTEGPVNPTDHYFVPRQEIVDDLVVQITRGKYFTIYAPRQMGKTTLLRQLRTKLAETPNYFPITLSFQRFEQWETTHFLQKIGGEIAEQLLQEVEHLAPDKQAHIQELVASQPPINYEAFWDFFTALHRLAPDMHVVLVIDEFDATPQAAISPLLQTWREFYLLHEPPRSLHSVVLIGIQNIAALNLGRSSPFNIASQLQLDGFTPEQVANLFYQHTADTGQPFLSEVVTEIYQLTHGHPFLVNRLGQILTQDLVPERSQPITPADLAQAKAHLVEERNYNSETIVRHARAHEAETLNILFGERFAFTPNHPVINDLLMQGVIRKSADGYCEIANPIYQLMLTAAFRPLKSSLQGATLINGYDFRSLAADGALRMPEILSRFRQFVERRGREAFNVTPTPREATGQYLLMAYLELVVRQVGGDLFSEVNSGTGRLDLLVVYHGRRYVIETKIWDGQVEFEQGLAQLARYLENEGTREGYYVVFHVRPRVYGKLAFDELEFATEQGGVKVHIVLVRLGKIFDEED